MGLIGLINEINHQQFISIESAFEFLKEVENTQESRYSSFKDIAEFLMRYQFDNLVENSTYGRYLDGSYHLISSESYNTTNALSDIISTNKLKRVVYIESVVFEEPFNLYWKKQEFIQAIESIFKSIFGYQNDSNIPPMAKLPNIDQTLSKLTKRRIELKLLVPDYQERPSLEERIISLIKENQRLKEKIETQDNHTQLAKITELQAEITRLKSEFIQQENQQNHKNSQAKRAENKQAEIITALAMMYTKTDCSKPYETAETIRQEWQRQADKLGNPPTNDTLAKYIKQGLERLKP